MKALYWHPGKISRRSLVVVTTIGLLGLWAVEHFPVSVEQPYRNLKLNAVTRTADCMTAVKEARIAAGHPISPKLDPTESGMIGLPFTQVTSVPGDLVAKQTSVNPNFAAVVVEMLVDAGVEQGDNVAVGFSGSFPTLNIAVLCAIESIGARPIVVSSATASQFGANIPNLLWIDMERLLNDRGLLQSRSAACSVGGHEDQATGISAEGLLLIDASIEKSGATRLDPVSFTAAIDQRMEIYQGQAGGMPIKAYVNVGGGAVSTGRSIGKSLYEPGLNRRASAKALQVDSVMTRMMRSGVPVVHLVEVRQLAEKFGFPTAPQVPVPLGTGAPFVRVEKSRLAALIVLALMVATLGTLVSRRRAGISSAAASPGTNAYPSRSAA